MKTYLILVPISIIAKSWESIKQFFWLPTFIAWYSSGYQSGLWILVMIQFAAYLVCALFRKEVDIQESLLSTKVRIFRHS